MARRTPIPLNRHKLKALVHYICHKAPPEMLGKTKLNKILYYADTNAYVRLGDALTGETYLKHQYGPVSKHLDAILDELEEDGALASKPELGNLSLHSGSGTFKKGDFFSVKKPSLKGFIAEEVALIDEVIDWICFNHTARSISQHSHDEVWQLLEMGEVIPYAASYVSKLGKVTEDDVAWAKGKIKELKLKPQRSKGSKK